VGLHLQTHLRHSSNIVPTCAVVTITHYGPVVTVKTQIKYNILLTHPANLRIGCIMGQGGALPYLINAVSGSADADPLMASIQN
jgi:hypothetical protein